MLTTTLRSVVLAAILAPAVLFLPAWPDSADGAERASPPVSVASVEVRNCQRAAWPYNANCAEQQAAPQLRLISTDRVPAAGGR